MLQGTQILTRPTLCSQGAYNEGILYDTNGGMSYKYKTLPLPLPLLLSNKTSKYLII